jgi:hypothetical protein
MLRKLVIAGVMLIASFGVFTATPAAAEVCGGNIHVYRHYKSGPDYWTYVYNYYGKPKWVTVVVYNGSTEVFARQKYIGTGTGTSRINVMTAGTQIIVWWGDKLPVMGGPNICGKTG